MSQENVELVRAWFASMGGGIEARLRFLHPQVEWHVRGDFPDTGVYRGHDGFRELAARFNEILVQQQYEPLDIIDAGGHVVVPLRWTAQGRLSGASFIERFETWVFTVEDDSIRTVVEFATKEAALEAVGLRE
jgi:ketosteroid isomerase-like protein